MATARLLMGSSEARLDAETFGYFPISDENFAKSIGRIYQKYRKHLVLPLVQEEYLAGRGGPERTGVCRAMSIHWAKRFLKGKPSFRMNKGRVLPIEVEVGLSWNRRMAKKFEKFASRQTKLKRRENIQELGLYSKQEKLLFSRDNPTLDFFTRSVEMIDSNSGRQAFLLRLRPQTGVGHMVALGTQVTKDGVLTAVIDPNVGEFCFAPEDTFALKCFMADLLKAYIASIDLHLIRGIEVGENIYFNTSPTF